ncbi:Dak1 domain-containing protein [Mucor mucedo]|uniref:Dak1 domain-containing protein n=1 Tax=Mucor mucedo TaxID=29922 RepID=UPI0022202FC3|nr:Dak1 domain-containing protein [Mucor mucedo]KAI7888576.1 Dak1 domain-containing protein [Mucor mucedo]
MNHTAAKHILNTPETLVTESLQGLCYTNPNIRILEKEKVVYYTNVDEMASKQVTLVSGGGSGHEPGYASFVGNGGLAASVSGHVFASPSSSQVLAAIQRVQSPHGTLVIIMNYTGDCLNFGLAVERAKALGIKVELIAVGDDISVGKTKGGKVGRRGMAATALAVKLAGALASRGASLEKVKEMVQHVIENAATLGVAFDHCHVPGSSSFSCLAPNELEIGMGIHNENGFLKTDMMSAKDLVNKMMHMLLDQDDEDRSYLNLDTDKKNSIIMLVNNLGGIAQLELSLAVKEAVDYVLHMPYLHLERVLVGPFVTSLNMPGFSITLLSVKDHMMLDLLDQPISIPGWPSAPAVSFSTEILGNPSKLKKTEHTVDDFMGQVSDPDVMEAAIRGAAEAVIEAEPRITDYDTVLGDGDCGQTLKTAAQGENSYFLYIIKLTSPFHSHIK